MGAGETQQLPLSPEGGGGLAGGDEQGSTPWAPVCVLELGGWRVAVAEGAFDKIWVIYVEMVPSPFDAFFLTLSEVASHRKGGASASLAASPRLSCVAYCLRLGVSGALHARL